MKKSKNGYAHIMVICILLVISILGMAISSLAVTNYNMAMLNSNKTSNLYASEAGLDEAYAIIGGEIDKAIEKGNDSVKKFMDNLDLIAAMQEEKKRKRSIEKGEYTEETCPYEDSPYINDDFSINKKAIEEKQNELFQEAYKGSILDSENDENKIIAKLNNPSSYQFKVKDGETPVIQAEICEEKDESEGFKDDKEKPLLTIRVSSKFKHDDIEKKVRRDYSIFVPEYGGEYYLQYDGVKILKNPVWAKAIACDGNMSIDSGQLSIEGDIYVNGNHEDDRRDNGIILDGIDPAVVDVTGNVITSENINISSINSNFTVNGDIYAKNVFLNKDASGSKLMVSPYDGKSGSVYTSDDLEIAAKDSEVCINGGYYGISDGSKSANAGQSSSININAVNNDGSVATKLTIVGKSIIMGTSYVEAQNNKGEEYQTGESVSIKGGYKAYSNTLKKAHEDDKFNEENVVFDYYTPTINGSNNYPPIKFVTRYKESGSEKDLTVFDKGQYYKYYNEENKESKNKWDGININTQGSIYIGTVKGQDGSIELGNYNIDDFEEVDNKVKEFNNMAYGMGSDLGNKENPATVKKQVNFDAITEGVYDCGKLGVIVLLKDDDDYNIEYDSYAASSYIDYKNKTIVLNNDQGIIIAKGGLKVFDDFSFTGTIISGGDIDFSSSGNNAITYDDTVVKTLIGYRYDMFSDIFTNDSLEEEYVKFEANLNIENSKYSIKKDNLIKISNWVVEK